MTYSSTQQTTMTLGAIATVALLTLPAVVVAHDLVLVPEPNGNLTVRFGHPGDWQVPDKERLLDLQVSGSAGAAASSRR